MARSVLVAWIVFVAAGCSNSSDPPNNPSAVVPKAGSSFTLRLTDRGHDTTMITLVTQSGLTLDSISNVVTFEDGFQYGFTYKRDLAIKSDGRWLVLPITTRKELVIDSLRHSQSAGTYVDFDNRTSFLGLETRTVDGNILNCVRVQHKEVSKYYEADSTLSFSDSNVTRYTWAPEIGYFAFIEFVDSLGRSQELIAYDLK